MTRLILLGFDVEEFDIPQEYGQTVPPNAQIEVSTQGLHAVLRLLERLDIRATLFTTAHFALQQRELIKQAAGRHEIASHQYWHSAFDEADLLKSRVALEEITGGKVTGFRRARLAPTSPAAITAAGYVYNSSENPIWLPGRYNNLRQPRTAYEKDGLLNIPVSASPGIRFPLFWLAFKNFPLPFIQAASWHTLAHDGYLNIYFHPWEFADILAYQLPWYVKRRAGRPLLQRLERYLVWLKKQGEFTPMGEFAAAWRKQGK